MDRSLTDTLDKRQVNSKNKFDKKANLRSLKSLKQQ